MSSRINIDLDALRAAINPAFAQTKGTESYERRVLVEEIDRLRTALGFYANEKNWDIYGVVHNDPPDCSCRMKHHHPDLGHVAREALKG